MLKNNFNNSNNYSNYNDNNVVVIVVIVLLISQHPNYNYNNKIRKQHQTHEWRSREEERITYICQTVLQTSGRKKNQCGRSQQKRK